ncbi:E3 ubiquitin-protein ligase MARCHF11 [Drosophila bipectinata]|uniref:E3 ubiquitin-protein ligase MARCHF11 n=1 Tax=Drosophila bipectinata TaxID=42026 RepID=UPI001C893312|nr:E3 ubiquitin-protein ligase MARCHF11 [Drosophila bipectinata]
MSQHQHPILSEETALRLLNGVVATGNSTPLSAVPTSPPTPPPTLVEGQQLPEASCSTALVGGGQESVHSHAFRTEWNGIDEVATDNATPLSAVQTPPSTPPPNDLEASCSTELGEGGQESVHSANEYGHSCRICRWNRSDMEIISCPCNCRGSVGFIHLKCLKRWIMHRRDNRCEVCNAVYDISEERVSLKQMLRTFCCGRCCGLIVKHLLFSASLMPLAHIILQQVLQCMDNLNQGSTEQLTVQEVFVASCALLTSSALFFHFFEFVTTRCLLIRNILRHWWMFGSTSDFSLVEFEDDSIDLF